MTIEEIKTVSIHEWLMVNGYGSGHKRGKKIWYSSPLRAESSPSFGIDIALNLWHDYGKKISGNVISLVQHIHPEWSAHEVLVSLEQQIKEGKLHYTIDPIARLKEQEAREEWIRQQRKNQEAKSLEVTVLPLSHPYLIDYIQQRRIDLNIARLYCQEVHYLHEGKPYYAISFPNIDGGLEARSKYFKRCIGHKTISRIMSTGHPQTHCCIFEGFFDLLTYLTIQQWMDIGICIPHPTDYYVLNSTSCVHTLLPFIKEYSYIHCYLDNDKAGKEATQTILTSFPDTAIDESVRYTAYNDLNDVITGNPISSSEQATMTQT